jgi:hypothetical protein
MKKNVLSPALSLIALFLIHLPLAAQEGAAGPPPSTAEDQASTEAQVEADDTYDQETILQEAEKFFGSGAEGLGKVMEKAFKDHGRPNGYITGEEAGGAIAVGVRYGKGRLTLKSGASRQVYWQGPSIGFDLGANAAKVFVLVYNLPNPDALFQRYPGVDGSLYFVAGVGINYVQSGDTVLAPIRFGVGWRQGLNVGYMHLTREKSWIPF